MDIVNLIEESLLKYLPSENCREADVIKSMKYSLTAGGKRIRPMLVLEFCKLCAGDIMSAVPFACAVEMVHTYSLIHDDLPCMDNDDMRRGKPSNHIKFGEATALLAGDALQSLAFETMLNADTVAKTGADKAVRAAAVLARNIGACGMVGGQIIDLEYEDKSADADVLREMHSKKTSALISAACEIGCIIGGADEKQLAAARGYAENIGLAFQIVDDMLDVTSDENTLGKPVGSDEQNDKSTFVTLYGLEKCGELVDEYTSEAVNCLNVFDGDVSALKALAYSLAKRKK